MKLRAMVDRAECLRRGVDAQDEWVELEVDPGALESWEREVLSRLIEQNQKTGALELTWRWVSPRDGRLATSAVALCPPTMEGLRAAILDARRKLAEARREEARS